MEPQIAFYEKKLEKVYNPLLNSKIDIKYLWTSATPQERSERIFSSVKPFIHLIDDKELRKQIRKCIAYSRESHSNLHGWDEFKQYDINSISGVLQNLWEKQIEPKLEDEAQNASDKLESLVKFQDDTI